MAFQRKVFRIEEGVRRRSPERGFAVEIDGAPIDRELLAELEALRALVAPRAQLDRETMERVRAQIAEAQAYKRALDMILQAIGRTRDEAVAAGADPLAAERTARAGRELQAVVTGTEQATQKILQAAEEIERTAETLADALKGGHEKGLADDIQDRVLQIFEACNFQDLTGQRVANVVATLNAIEDRVSRLLRIWRGIEQIRPIVLETDDGAETRYLNGPRLPEDRGHSTQDEIDEIFRCAKAG
jgi:chemotaxis protein CheZ